MSSITTIEGYTFNNWGALTTTFTAPTSTVKPTTADPNPADILQRAYFSPGLYCPSGWATVGIAVRNTDKSLSTSGILATNLVNTYTAVPQWENPATLLMELLDPQRGCFISMTADMSAGVGCYFTVSDYKVTQGCYGVIPGPDIGEATKTQTWDGATVTGLVNEVTATYPITEIRTLTFDESRQPSLIGVSVMLMTTLVHHQSNVKAAGTAAATSNAVSRIASRPTTWDGLGTVCGVLAAGMALGVAIVL
ncbi:hypothetical protein PENDEC_c024G04666 [Penicillium decumbens]|uniref:Uncharacterized protein n=1 Tax=Penicillium decumbens TaxID=69771 RepID=A0A1V6P071_PENDC|nr:hypothetical protein PENDEC_c024G04666 [Penicillium decumbens]